MAPLNLNAKPTNETFETLVSKNHQNIFVTQVISSITSETLKVGQTNTIFATCIPENASSTSVVWSSSDTNIVTVTQKGQITALRPGVATIYAIASETHNKPKVKWVYGTCDVTVIPSLPSTADVNVTSVNISAKSTKIETRQTTKLSASVTPANVRDKSIVWYSENSSVAKVDQNSNVTGVKAGKTQIYAIAGATYDKSSIKWIYAKCNVTVTSTLPSTTDVKVTGVDISANFTKIKIGHATKLSASVTPANASDKSIVWYSENSSVAKVDQSGNVTGVKAGTTQIYAIA